jgi:hypothetical protein
MSCPVAHVGRPVAVFGGAIPLFGGAIALVRLAYGIASAARAGSDHSFHG